MSKKAVKKVQGRGGVIGKSNGKPALKNTNQVSEKKKSAPTGIPVEVPELTEKPNERNNDILVIRVPTDWLHYLGMKAVEVEEARAATTNEKPKKFVGAATMARSIILSWLINEKKRNTTVKK
jgi:hypothetical protein